MSTSSDYIERLNYYSDSRTRPRSEVEIPEGLPTKWEVCPQCQGEGKHVNPSIDAGGLTREDFLEDPDFMHDYMSGLHDVACNTCGGKRVVKVVDEQGADPELLQDYYDELEAEAADWATQRAELIAGC